MKKRILVCILFVLCVALGAMCLNVTAATEGDFGYYVANGEATVTGYSGSGGKVTIPSTLGGYPVTAIADYTFSNCSELTEMVIPSGVKSIGTGAFEECKNLTAVTIPGSVTVLGEAAFYNCSGLVAVTIPGSVQEVGMTAFGNCTNLSKVTLEKGVMCIGETAFYNCTNLTDITFPSTLTTVDHSAFYGCTALSEVVFPDGLTKIGSSVFYGCTALTSVSIPDTVTVADCDEISGMQNLQLNTYDNAKYLGNAKNPYVVLIKATSTEITSVKIHPNTKIIANSAFIRCSKLTSVTIPEGVKAVGMSAFNYCSGLKSVTIPKTVAKIYDYAFGSCTSLTSVTIPANLSFSAFSGCTNLATVTITEGVTSIYSGAFYGCTNLTNVTLPDSLSKMDVSFSNCTKLNYTTYGNAKYLGTAENPYLFLAEATSMNITSVNIHANTKLIAAGAFSECTKLTSVNIPNGVIFIGYGAFQNCTALTTATIPGTVSSLENTFYGCAALKAVTLGNGITTIGSNAFNGCTSLKTLTIPNSVTSIGECAFSRCSGLTSITIPNSVATIDGGAFQFCTGLTSIVFSEGVTHIGSAFNGCTGLTSVKLPSTLVSLRATFIGCTNLVSVTLPESLTSIGPDTFAKCSKLTKIVIPERVRSILHYAFSNCTALEAIYFQGNAPKIDSYAGTTKYYPINDPTWSEYFSYSSWKAYEPLKITKQPESVGVKNGEKATVKVTAVGDGLTYRWYYKNKGDKDYTYTSSFKGNTYSVTMNDARAGRRVICRVYDKYGNVVKSETVLLAQAVRITKQPTTVVAKNGETATVKITAVGDGLTYRWYYKNKGDKDYTYTSSFKGNTYSVTMNDARAGRRVICRVYDKYGNVVKSETVLLAQAVRITKQPVSVTVAEGKTAKVTVTAVGDGLTYRWYYKNKGDKDYTYTSSFKGNTYSVTMNDARAGRRVICRVYDKYGNVVRSESVLLSQSV